jgi:hypothetical protein
MWGKWYENSDSSIRKNNRYGGVVRPIEMSEIFLENRNPPAFFNVGTGSVRYLIIELEMVLTHLPHVP